MDDPTKRKDELEQFQKLWDARIKKGNPRITLMPVDERPRERLLAKGPVALSDLDLMAVLLGKGTRSCDVFSLAALVLKAMDHNGARPDVNELQKIAGVGPAKAAGKLLGIQMLDHIVFNHADHYSFLENGEL